VTTGVDLWRAVDPDARIVAGSAQQLLHHIRGVARTRVAAPHLPPSCDGELLVADARLVGGATALFELLHAAQLAPAAVLLAGAPGGEPVEGADDVPPMLASAHTVGTLAQAAEAYLADERAVLERISTELRLACAEAALAEPAPGTPAGLIAMRMRRGVAVIVGGELAALHARPAGRGLAARFVALHQRRLTQPTGHRFEAFRRRDGLWLLEREIRPGSSAWFFDDLPFAAVDSVALDALRMTMRALLQRPTQPPSEARPRAAARQVDAGAGDVLRQTLLAVARANGRVAPAARALGVHRNTVLYRLRRGRNELGVDPRRADDALRLLRDAAES
jgi:hypothetical protein